MVETTKAYISRYRKKYKKLNTVFCPALRDKVFFTAEGFNHLLYKKGHRRPLKQIKYRLPLINLIIPTIKNCQKIRKTRIREEVFNGRKIIAAYFELSHLVGRKHPTKVKVIVKKRGEMGRPFFLSVMKQKTSRKGR